MHDWHKHNMKTEYTIQYKWPRNLAMKKYSVLIVNFTWLYVDYASEVLCGQSISQMKDIEGVQRQVTCYIFGIPRFSVPYQEHLSRKNLFPLTGTKSVSALMYLWNI